MHSRNALSTLAIVLTSAQLASAQNDADRSAIQQAVAAYEAAFNARDAKKLASLWSPEGVYVSRTSGEQVSGRQNLEQEFSTLFSLADTPKLEVITESIEFVSPNVALERGKALLIGPGDATDNTRYSAVYVRREGQWLVDRVSEEDAPEATSYDQLKVLEWLIGEWIDEDDQISIETECRWTKNRNYISRTYRVAGPEGVELSGLQIIGWDAKQNRIRSWLFDSSGGFISGSWTQHGDRWSVQSVATLADGSSGSFTSLFRPIDDNRYAWQKVHRVVDGEILPNVDEVIVRRR